MADILVHTFVVSNVYSVRQLCVLLYNKEAQIRRKSKAAVNLKTGRFDNIDSTAIISSVCNTSSFVLLCIHCWWWQVNLCCQSVQFWDLLRLYYSFLIKTEPWLSFNFYRQAVKWFRFRMILTSLKSDVKLPESGCTTLTFVVDWLTWNWRWSTLYCKLCPPVPETK